MSTLVFDIETVEEKCDELLRSRKTSYTNEPVGNGTRISDSRTCFFVQKADSSMQAGSNRRNLAMLRREVSQWTKEELFQWMLTGQIIRIDVREIGLPIATHHFTSPGDLSFVEMHCAVMAFFMTIPCKRIGSVYIFTP